MKIYGITRYQSMDDHKGSKVFDAKVEEVRSGDDFILLVSLGVDGLYKKTRARLHGVDVPNAYKARADTEAGMVREEIRQLLSTGRCTVELLAEGKGGWIVVMLLHCSDGRRININDMLTQRGYVYERQEFTE